MIHQYYLRELSNLRELAVEFARKHPALAPMLSGPTADPDAERLLEGTAFLSGMIRQKLDDEFPEIIHSLMRLIFPHYLSPIPSLTILKFSPKKALMESILIPAGCQAASIPVQDTSCLFTTCYDVELHPLALTEASLDRREGGLARLSLRLELTGMALSRFTPDRLRFHLAGDYSRSADRHHLLFTHTRSITLRPLRGGSPFILPKSALVPVGLDPAHGVLPYPAQSFPGYRILQEYFILPEKLLFFDLTGLNRWRDRGDGSGFEIIFDLEKVRDEPPPVAREHFVLFATPAVNLFPHDADPIFLDHKFPEYRITPSGGSGNGAFAVHTVRKVSGFVQGAGAQREYQPFEMFNPQVESIPVYTLNFRPNPLGGKVEPFISVAYPFQAEGPKPETLSLDILCTNASLPENLQVGDVCKPTESSPVLADFGNIIRPTASREPPLGRESLWRLLSHLYLNYLPIADRENLRALVKLYIFSETRDRAAVLANVKRADAIADLAVQTQNRLVSGVMMRGQRIEMKLDPAGFAGVGDMYLFASVLDCFLAGYAAVNCYTQLTVEDTLKKVRYEWPARIGERFLL